MDVKYRIDSGRLTVALIGELDHHSALPARRLIDELARKNEPREVLFDFSGLSFMDSTGIGMLLSRYKAFSSEGIAISVTGAKGSVDKLLKLSGIYNIFTKI